MKISTFQFTWTLPVVIAMTNPKIPKAPPWSRKSTGVVECKEQSPALGRPEGSGNLMPQLFGGKWNIKLDQKSGFLWSSQRPKSPYQRIDVNHCFPKAALDNPKVSTRCKDKLKDYKQPYRFFACLFRHCRLVLSHQCWGLGRGKVIHVETTAKSNH